MEKPKEKQRRPKSKPSEEAKHAPAIENEDSSKVTMQTGKQQQVWTKVNKGNRDRGKGIYGRLT